MSSKTIVELEHVAMKFGNYAVHKDISFKIQDSEVVTLLGPSGTGKTVILKLIIGLLYPTAGRVIVMDNDISQLKEEQLTKLRQNIGMLFQGAALFDSLTVYENIAYSLRERRDMPEEDISQIVKEKLALIGLPGIEQKYPPALSGGQKKRVGLARALASSPQVMLFDEPTTGLDPSATKLIADLIARLRDEFGITSLVVTHDIETARRVSDRWLLINKGMVIADGEVNKILNSDKTVVDFIEGRWQDEIRV